MRGCACVPLCPRARVPGCWVAVLPAWVRACVPFRLLARPLACVRVCVRVWVCVGVCACLCVCVCVCVVGLRACPSSSALLLAWSLRLLRGWLLGAPPIRWRWLAVPGLGLALLGLLAGGSGGVGLVSAGGPAGSPPRSYRSSHCLTISLDVRLAVHAPTLMCNFFGGCQLTCLARGVS